MVFRLFQDVLLCQLLLASVCGAPSPKNKRGSKRATLVSEKVSKD